MFSGHSLMGRPMPDHLQAIARSQGRPWDWEQHYGVGSLLRWRVQGEAPVTAPPGGWRLGSNKDGQGLAVDLALAGRLPGVPAFDTLVATERHDILWAMLHERSATYLRVMHDLRHRGSPRGATWLYESWQSFPDPARLEAWLAHERRVAPVWQCVAAAVNESLQTEGRRDRVHSLPAARALTLLVERAVSAPGVPGISQPGVAQTLAVLFSDRVHLTTVGSYYMAAVTGLFLGLEAPETPWHPDGVTPQQARSLWAVARQAHAALRDQSLVRASAADCARVLRESCGPYGAYVEMLRRVEGDSAWRAQVDRRREQWRCSRAIGRGDHQVDGVRLRQLLGG